MRFDSLRLKNIRSYTDETITFPTGTLLLTCDIGAGKTTSCSPSFDDKTWQKSSSFAQQKHPIAARLRRAGQRLFCFAHDVGRTVEVESC
jgi:hypothetical protein